MGTVPCAPHNSLWQRGTSAMPYALWQCTLWSMACTTPNGTAQRYMQCGCVGVCVGVCISIVHCPVPCCLNGEIAAGGARVVVHGCPCIVTNVGGARVSVQSDPVQSDKRVLSGCTGASPTALTRLSRATWRLRVPCPGAIGPLPYCNWAIYIHMHGCI